MYYSAHLLKLSTQNLNKLLINVLLLFGCPSVIAVNQRKFKFLNFRMHLTMLLTYRV